MNLSLPIKSFEQFREVVYAFRLPRILFSAFELDLFNVIGDRHWTISQLANQLQASTRGLNILCRNLSSVGLLLPSSSGYRAAPFSKKYLQKTSPHYRGDYLALMQRQWKEWSRLTDIIQTGQPLDGQEPETDEYRQSFTWAMHQRSLQSAKDVAQQVNLKGARTLLDLGGGPGTYSLAFLARNPGLQATVMDRPAALEVARLLAQQSSLGKRLDCHAADFVQDPIAGRYDVVWYSNVLHIYSPADNVKIFKKIRTALNPKGRLLIQDTFLQGPKGLRPLEANLFAVSMLLYTEGGNTYASQEVRKWLQQAGLPRSRMIHLKEGTGDWEGQLIEARPPAAK